MGLVPSDGPDLAALEPLTAPFRASLAARHSRRALASRASLAALESARARATAELAAVGEVLEVPEPPPSVRRVRRRKGKPPELVEVPGPDALDSHARWHENREQGQLRRMLKVEHCGEGEVAISCADCGGGTEMHPIRCGTVRLCTACMARRAALNRARFARAKQEICQRAWRARLYEPFARGGRWSEKHLTLTIPHELVLDEDGGVDVEATAETRIVRIFQAWSRFVREIERYYRKRAKRLGGASRQGQRERFYRAFEWTMGEDGMGHPHFHVWIFGPFLPMSDWHVVGRAGFVQECAGDGCEHCAKRSPLHDGVRSWWARALAAVGLEKPGGGAFEPDELVLDIRKVVFQTIEFVREICKPDGLRYEVREVRVQSKSDAGLVTYFEPWSICDRDIATGERASNAVMAAVYRALEGRRMSQGSSGLMAIGDRAIEKERAHVRGHPGCTCCGSVGGAKRIAVTSWQKKDWPDDAPRGGDARGPPSEAALTAPQWVDPSEFSALIEQAAEDLRTSKRPFCPRSERC